MVETSKLETVDTAEKTLTAIRSRLDKTRNLETLVPINLIDAGDFDHHVLPHGQWPEEEEYSTENETMEVD
jgi:hypothetical protein